MKHYQRIVVTLLVITTLLAVVPVSAFAAYRVEALKFNQWYSLKEGVKSVYKVKVSSDTIIIATWKNNHGDAHAAIYTDKECDEDSLYYYVGYGSPVSGSDGVVLYPGTYYIYMYDNDNKVQIKFAKKSNRINKQNYCIGKAILMTKNKKYEFSQTKNGNYKRWYKIKLAKSQIITITGYEEYDYTLYDSNFNEINCKYSKKNNTITTRGKQPKGIYYLALREEDLDSILDKGYYYSIYWK